MDLTALYVDVDDFWQQFRPAYEQRLLADGIRRRKPLHFLAHLLAGLIAYARQPRKPALKFSHAEQAQLAMID